MAEHYCRHCKTGDCDCGQFDGENCQYCKECAGQGWSPDPEASVVFAHRDGIFENRAGKTTKLPSMNDFLKTASTEDVRGLNAFMNRDLVRKKALAWVEKQPGQDAPSIHILNLLDIISGLTTQNTDRLTEHELYAGGFQNAIHKVAYDFVRYYVDGTEGCRNCGGFPHSSTCFVGRFESAIMADYMTRSAPVIKEMFTAGWNAGFREAQEPDRYPDRDRCEDAFQEWIKERNDAAEQQA